MRRVYLVREVGRRCAARRQSHGCALSVGASKSAQEFFEVNLVRGCVNCLRSPHSAQTAMMGGALSDRVSIRDVENEHKLQTHHRVCAVNCGDDAAQGSIGEKIPIQ